MPKLTDRFRKDADEYVRDDALDALAKIDPAPATISLLIKALKDKESHVRASAARGLLHMGPPAQAAIDPLIAALQDEDSRVRSSAACALGTIGPKARSALSSLMETLKDPITEVYNSAACALARIDREKTAFMVDRLLAALKDKEADVRENAALSLGAIGPLAKAALPQLVEALKDKLAVRLSAREAIKKINPDTAKRLGLP